MSEITSLHSYDICSELSTCTSMPARRSPPALHPSRRGATNTERSQLAKKLKALCLSMNLELRSSLVLSPSIPRGKANLFSPSTLWLAAWLPRSCVPGWQENSGWEARKIPHANHFIDDSSTTGPL